LDSADLGCTHHKWGCDQSDWWQERLVENERESFKQTKNDSHGRRMGGQMIGNATKKNQYQSICEEEDETYLSHFVATSSLFNID